MPYWPALVLVLEGRATLGEICGDTPDLEDMALMSIATDAWDYAERVAIKRARK